MFRQFLRTPVFHAVAVATLALGIGANTTIFSLVNALMLRPLPFPEAGRLVFLSERMAHLDGMSISYPNLLDWQTQNVCFVSLAGFRDEAYNLTGGAAPERLRGLSVSANFFSTLGIAPLHGRVFAAEEDRPGGPRVAVISEGLWARRFGADPTILGRSIELDTERHVVIGIMPASFQFPSEVELWTPLGALAGKASWRNRGNHPGIYGIARLKGGVGMRQAQTEMDTIAARLAREYPDSNTGNGITAMTLRERMVREVRPALLLLLGAVAFVLLIACANLANLLLARSAARARELAVRAALGASRARIIRQLLGESLMLSATGALCGLVLAWWGVGLLRQLIPPELQGTIQLEIDLNVLAFTAGLGLLTGLGFGLMPAWQSSRPELNTTLREGGRGAGDGRRSRHIRQALVAGEMALAMVLLVGASLLIRSFARLSEHSLGLNPLGVWTTDISLPVLKYTEEWQQLAFYERLVERLAASPGVSAVAVTGALLGGWQTTYLLEGKPPPEPGASPLADFAVVSPDYFKAMRIRLLRGRTFNPNDTKRAVPVGIIDEKFALKHWPQGEPIGQRISTGDSNQWMTIVGVVAHVKNYGVEQESREEIYVPMAQHPMAAMALVVQAEQGSVAGVIRAAAREIDREQPLTTIQSVEQILARQVAPRRLATFLLGAFSALALGLAALGIYGVVSYATAQRTREIGVRLALGARPFDVLSMVLRQAGTVVFLGMGIGLAGAVALSRLMSSLVFGITTSDPFTYLLTPVVLLATGFVACYFPARRAAYLDPIRALREE
jgi:putative ABC transport system permease protein